MFENIPCKAKGFGTILDNVGFVTYLNINAKNLSCIVSRNRYVCVRLGLCTHAESYVHRLILTCVSFGIIFQKLIYCSSKVIFFILILLKSI